MLLNGDGCEVDCSINLLVIRGTKIKVFFPSNAIKVHLLQIDSKYDGKMGSAPISCVNTVTGCVTSYFRDCICKRITGVIGPLIC